MLKKAAGTLTVGKALMNANRKSPLGVPPIVSAFFLFTEPPEPVICAVIWLEVVVDGGVPTRCSGQLSPRPVPAVLVAEPYPEAASEAEIWSRSKVAQMKRVRFFPAGISKLAIDGMPGVPLPDAATVAVWRCWTSEPNARPLQERIESNRPRSDSRETLL